MLAALWWPPELVGFIFLIVYQRKVRNFLDCALCIQVKSVKEAARLASKSIL